MSIGWDKTASLPHLISRISLSSHLYFVCFPHPDARVAQVITQRDFYFLSHVFYFLSIFAKKKRKSSSCKLYTDGD
jgi:hypothetical protein